MNAVESLLAKLGLDRYNSNFRRGQVDRVATLRSMSDGELTRLVPHASDRSTLQRALHRTPTPTTTRKPKDDKKHGTGPLLRTFPSHESNPPSSTRPSDPTKGSRNRSSRNPPSQNTHGRRSNNHPSSSSSSPTLPPVCRAFHTPTGCPRGTRCPYRHSDSPIPNNNNNDLPISSSSSPTTTPTTRAAPVCRNFNSPHGCVSGQGCRYRHVVLRQGEKTKAENGSSSSTPTTAAIAHEENPKKSHSRPAGVCHNFNSPEGCGRGEGCRYFHMSYEEAQKVLPGAGEVAAGMATTAVMTPGSEGTGEGGVVPPRFPPRWGPREGDAEITVTIPAYKVKLLLGNGAAALVGINKRHNVVNSEIPHPEDFTSNISFSLYGALESLEAAKEEVQHLVGITKEKEAQNRLDYLLHQSQRNVHTMEILGVANVRHQGTERELPEPILRQIASKFSYRSPELHVKEYFIVVDAMDNKRIQLLDVILSYMENRVQSVVFCAAEKIDTVTALSERTAGIAPFGGFTTPTSLKPPSGQSDGVESKIHRMTQLEKFKLGVDTASPVGGQGSAGVVAQRLLVTTDDYARYARTHTVPYVNLVLHYNFPANKEAYLLRRRLLGRGLETRGCSILFVYEREQYKIKQLQGCATLEELKLENLPEQMMNIAEALSVETKGSPYVQYSQVEPMGMNWKEDIYRREEEKAAARVAKEKAKEEEKLAKEKEKQERERERQEKELEKVAQPVQA